MPDKCGVVAQLTVTWRRHCRQQCKDVHVLHRLPVVKAFTSSALLGFFAAIVTVTVE